MAVLYGYIFIWDGFEARSDGNVRSNNFIDAVVGLKEFAHADSRQAVRTKWQEILFNSRKPLLGEDPGFIHDGWRYSVYVRVNDLTGTIIVGAKTYTIVKAFASVVNFKITPNMRRKVINIEELANHLLSPIPQEYALTYYMADVPGYGTALNTISLYGDDIASAEFLEKERSNFTARQIGVRSMSQRRECGRFGNSGSVQFWDDNLEGFEGFLRYTYKNGFYLD